MRQDACKVMMQGAALIVGVGRTMVVMGTTVAEVMVVSVIGDVDAGGVFRDVLFARDDMLEMDADQRHNARDLGHKK
jgi:hypothetical protein